MSRIILAKLVAMAAMWGGTFIAGRVIAPLLPHFTIGALRFAVASVVLVALVLARERRFPRLTGRQWGAMVALGFTGVFVFNAFFFGALERVPAGRGALIMALNPVGTAIGMWLIFGERMNAVRWGGIALALLGAAVIICRGDFATLFAGALGPGELMLFGSVLGWVSYTLIGRRVLGTISPLIATTYAALIGTAMLAAVAALEAPGVAIEALPAKGWLAIAYLGVLGTVISFLWYYEGVRAIGPSRTAIYINLVPVFGVVFAAATLGEPILGSMVVGGLLVITGVTLTNRTA